MSLPVKVILFESSIVGHFPAHKFLITIILVNFKSFKFFFYYLSYHNYSYFT